MSKRRSKHFDQLRAWAISYPVSLLDVEDAFYALTSKAFNTTPIKPEDALAMMPTILKQSVASEKRPALIAADIRRCI